MTKPQTKPKCNALKRDVTPCNAKKQDVTPSNEPKRETKQAMIMNLISRDEGATTAELIAATGWKPHSVRGHISNMIKKRKFNIQKATNKDGHRVYVLKADQEEAA